MNHDVILLEEVKMLHAIFVSNPRAKATRNYTFYIQWSLSYEDKLGQWKILIS